MFSKLNITLLKEILSATSKRICFFRIFGYSTKWNFRIKFYRFQSILSCITLQYSFCMKWQSFFI